LQSRGDKFAVKEIVPIRSDEFPVKAKRPFNSRLDLTRLRERFGITPPSWQQALDRELDALKATI
jgi:dTDP-4-dehydrorhamnose reductase